jgi:hypothetical protein
MIKVFIFYFTMVVIREGGKVQLTTSRKNYKELLADVYGWELIGVL